MKLSKIHKTKQPFRRKILSGITLLFVVLTNNHGLAAGYFREPAIHGDSVIFTAEGDLWQASVTGGMAHRLTSHPKEEDAACISPDGQWVAFAAHYEGPREIYLMPVHGGLPKRLTWHGEGASPVGWTNDGKIICATRAYSSLPNEQLVIIDPMTGADAVLPLAQASEGVYDATGKRLVFTRLPAQGSSTKRYQGGTAQNLWRFDEGAEEALPLTTTYLGTSKSPMLWQDRIYFLSDRTGVMNLWSMLIDGTDPKQLTKYADFDINHADLHDGKIVYQRAGSLHLFTLATGADQEISLILPSDRDQTRMRWTTDPLDFLTRFDLSPDGKKLALTARGSVFVAPVQPGGRFVEIPRASGIRYREACFLPNGKSLVAQTDETGEIEMVKLPADGMGNKELLTNDGGVFRFAPLPSPDGKWLAWQDKNLDLWVRMVAQKQAIKVSASPMDGFHDLAWSPDSRWLAFVEPAPNSFTRIRLFNTQDRSTIDATGDRVMSESPAWSADGKWLFFLSDRELKSIVRSPWGARQPEPFFTDSTRIYALSLRKNQRFPFTPPDELRKTTNTQSGVKRAKKSAKNLVTIDADGLEKQLYEVPDIKGNISNLIATPGYLFYTSKSRDGNSSRLMRLEIGHAESGADIFAENVKDYSFSLGGKYVALQKYDEFYVVATSGDCPAELEDAVSLSEWNFTIDPREEWQQIYRESWRMLRDYFYDPQMHGLDWVAIRKKYEPLVDRVADRADLNSILHEMAGELSALHIYVSGGDLREGLDNIEPSSLGARMSRDPANGDWKVEHIFASDPDYPNALSPLSRPGVEVNVGDRIRAINGRNLKDVQHPMQLLAHKAGQQVLLDVLAADGVTRRKVIVRPLTPEAASQLRYSEWEYTRRLETEKLGDGKIGYVHLRDMGRNSINAWAREFYPIIERQGLIIDMRNNQGGNTDSWILSRLMRKAWFYWSPRAGQSYTNMQYAFRGHIAVLCNEWTSSDGEAFTEGVRRLGLGKVFGTRTWGGQIWLDGESWLVDNGTCTAAEFGVYGPEGKWLIEGTGLDPDVIIDNAPHATFQGKDVQLDAAVKHLREMIEKDPRPHPAPPPRPNKSK